MKYIRTKDNKIYKIISIATKSFTKVYNIAGVAIDNEGNKFYLANDELEGSRQADTLEELIDEKILIEKDGHPTLLETVEFDKNIYLRINEYEFATQLPSNPIIYGSIWAYDSNGVPTLKPVAKMNDKGELELL